MAWPSFPRATRQACAEEELARVDLTGLKDAFPHTLSGGEQQRGARPHTGGQARCGTGGRAVFGPGCGFARRGPRHHTPAPQGGRGHSHYGDPRSGRGYAGGRLCGADAQRTAGADRQRRPRSVLFGGATVFHARVTKGCVVSPFGQTPTKSVAEGAWAEVLYRSASVRVADKSVPAYVLTVRPYAGQLEDEEAILGSALPEGVEAPTYVRAAAAMSTALTPGADIHLAAALEDAFVFPCRDEICRS